MATKQAMSNAVVSVTSAGSQLRSDCAAFLQSDMSDAQASGMMRIFLYALMSAGTYRVGTTSGTDYDAQERRDLVELAHRTGFMGGVL